MVPQSAGEIIEAISCVTAHAERELLEANLVSSLYQFFSADRVSLYKVFYEFKQPQCYLALDVVDNKACSFNPYQPLHQIDINETPGLEECIQSQAPMQTRLENDFCIYLHPVINHLGVVSEVFCLSGDHKRCQDNEKLIKDYIDISRNFLRLLDASEHDALTGLLNRRTFDQNLEKMLAAWHKQRDNPGPSNAQQLHRRSHKEIKGNWLAVIDIDHFKQVNDHYGHLYGDEVLLLLSNIMRDSFRGYDKLFRFGGEEFVVILRSTDQTGAFNALERFRAAIERYQFPQIGRITVSIGFVEITSQPIPAQVLGHADNALYYAKNHGRNQTCQFEGLVARGEIEIKKEISSQDIELF